MTSSTLASWLKDLALREGGRTALQLQSRQELPSALTFAQLDSQSDALAAGLAGQGLAAGDRIAIWLPNGPGWMVAHFAAAKAGLTTIPLNTWYRQAEVAHFLALSDARALIVNSRFHGIGFAAILEEALATGRCGTLRQVFDLAGPGQAMGVEWSDFAALWPPEDARLSARLLPNGTAIAFSTSGTTSAPKMAMHGEAALVSHASAVACRSGIGPGDVVLGALPPCGAYGYTLVLAALSAGARTLLLDWFDLDHLIAIIESEGVTVMALTEPILRALLDHPRATPASLRSLRLIYSAGGTLREVVERAERTFGFCVSNVYGSSEVLALAAFWNADSPVETRCEAGGEIVSAGMEVAACDDAGVRLADGQAGELRFRGPIITQGYLASPDATQGAFTADGWFRSGDLGFTLGQGKFRFISRMNDALRIRGFLVNPGEVEEMLLSHPAVDAAQVVGIPDGNGEDMAVAFVLLRPGAAAGVDDLRQLCRDGMASYKTPAAIHILAEFPTTRSANGDKVVKTTLRVMAMELMSHA